MYPFVLRNFLSDNAWPPFLLWTDEYLTEKLGKGKCLTVRIGEKEHFRGKVLHEHQCDRHTFANCAEMLHWMQSANNSVNENELASSSSYPNPTTHWAYLDYRDVLELFEQEEAEHVDWSLLGVEQSPEKGIIWQDSTVWIGTPGAYTPCHFDTYGFNLHAQLRGYKRWLLFSPDDDAQNKHQLWPTRLPYEESSVFSALDIVGDDHRINGKMSVWPVTVGPGDLLFVPPKWWHSVQCVDIKSYESRLISNSDRTQPNSNDTNIPSSSPVCISVNKWFTAPGDCRESAKEAVLKFMMQLFTKFGLLRLEEHICPMEHLSMDDDFDQLTELVEERLEKAENRPSSSSGLMAPKRFKKSPSEENNLLNNFYTKFSSHSKMERIVPIEWKQLKEKYNPCEESTLIVKDEQTEADKNSMSKGLMLEVLDAFSSSEVLDVLLNVLMTRRTERTLNLNYKKWDD